MALPQQDEEQTFDSPDGFALRVKHQKHTWCIPVEPRTTYEELATITLGLLQESSIPTPPEGTGLQSFDELKPDDIAFFTGNYTAATTANGSAASANAMRFVEIDRVKEETIQAMGLKDGADAVAYIGFRDKKRGSYLTPEVSIPPTVEEEADDNDVEFVAEKGKDRRL